MSTFTAWGRVRGECPHKHKTMEAAERCAEKDRRACRALGGGAYSDRYGHDSDCGAVRCGGWVGSPRCDCKSPGYNWSPCKVQEI